MVDKPDSEPLWEESDLRRVFVSGAAWWSFKSEGHTIWPSDRDELEKEAERRYPNGHLPEK